MIKALLRLRFLEIGGMYFRSGRSDKKKRLGKPGKILLITLLVIVLLFSFGALSLLFASNFLNEENDLTWLYFAFLGFLSFFFGAVGSAFTTYATLFKAKDNELLLSLPIPPRRILLTRMISVVLMDGIYLTLLYLPMAVVYFLYTQRFSVTVLLILILLWVGMIVFSTTFSCIFGWIVSLIAGKVRNKAVISALSTVIFLGIYYFCYFKMNSFLAYLLQDTEKAEKTISTYLFAFYIFGKGCSGQISYALLFLLFVLLLFLLVLFLLSKTFIGIATKSEAGNAGTGKVGFRAKASSKTLLQKEFRRLLHSATYLSNTGLGVVILIVLSVFAVIKSGELRELFSLLNLEIGNLMTVFVGGAMMLLLSMNCFTAPSVSLEGKNIWILKSLPLDEKEIFRAKERMCVLINGIAVLISVPLIGIALSLSVLQIVLLLFLLLGFIMMSADFGLLMNLRKTILDWTIEAVPIKQSSSVAYTMFGGWLLGILFSGGGFLLRDVMDSKIYLLIWILILFGLFFFFRKKLYTWGVRKFREL